MFLDPCEADGDTFSVHSYCSTLLAALAVVGSPLDMLYRLEYATMESVLLLHVT
jgi:hypothetical protein